MKAYVPRSPKEIRAAGKRYRWVTLRQFFVNVTFTLCVFSVGLKASAWSHDGMWFARSGALVTAIQLFVLIRRLRLNSAMTYATSQMKGWEETLALYGGSEPFPTTVRTIEKVRKQYEQLEDRLGWVNENLAVLFVQRGESWLLLLSTLIWGFGDLAGKIFNR